MKKIVTEKNGWSLLLLLTALFMFGIQSCDDNPDKFELSDGIPEIYYVRVPNPESADSLLVKAFMDNSIVLVGKNLTSIREMWFNDKKALLNSSFITDNNLFVTVPKEIPTVVTDKWYHASPVNMHTTAMRRSFTAIISSMTPTCRLPSPWQVISRLPRSLASKRRK